MKELYVKKGWVNIEKHGTPPAERGREFSEDVLVYTNKGNVAMDCFFYQYFQGDGFWVNHRMGDGSEIPTHWREMCLPQGKPTLAFWILGRK